MRNVNTHQNVIISTFPRILRNFSHYSRYFSHIIQSLELTKNPNPKISGQPTKELFIINNQHDRYWIYCNHFVAGNYANATQYYFLNHCASIIAKYWYKICCPHFEDAMHEWGQVNIVNIFRNFSIWNIIHCLKYQNTIKNISIKCHHNLEYNVIIVSHIVPIIIRCPHFGDIMLCRTCCAIWSMLRVLMTLFPLLYYTTYNNSLHSLSSMLWCGK